MAGWIDEVESSEASDAPASEPAVTGLGTGEGNPVDAAPQTEAPVASVEADAVDTSDSHSEPPSAEQSTKSVPLPALQEERKQKQALKQQLDAAEKRALEFQARLEAMEKAKASVPDPYENDDAILDDLPGALKHVAKRQDEALREWKMNASEELARDQFPDYDELMQQHYFDAAKADPSLAQKVEKATMPAIAAYKAVKSYLERKDFNPEEVKSLKEENARLRQELEERKKKGTVVVPTGVANARSQGSAIGGTTPLRHSRPQRDIWPL
jgi:hypothetical protein